MGGMNESVLQSQTHTDTASEISAVPSIHWLAHPCIDPYRRCVMNEKASGGGAAVA